MAVNWRLRLKASPRVVLVSLVVGLWMLTLYSIAIIGLALFLYSHKLVDSTMAAGVHFSSMGSSLSLIYVFAHCLLSRRFRSAALRRPKKTRLNSACNNLPRLLMLLWIVATAMDLIVASRRPACLLASSSAGLWASGLSCRMQHAIGALSVLALISTCSIFCVNELSDESFHASLMGYHEATLHNSTHITSHLPKPSCSISSSSSSSSFDKSQKLYHVYDLDSGLACHSSWIRRRDSISSQLAVYPPALLARISYGRSWSLGSQPGFEEEPTLTQTRTMTPSGSIPGITASAWLAPSSYSQPSRMPSTFLSTSATWCSPLSTMHCASQPEMSIDLLSKTLDPSSSSCKKPRIRHVPLSDDPAIRKLSEGGDPNESSSDDETRRLVGPTGSCLKERGSITRKLFPDVSRSIVSSPISSPPTLLGRNASHSAIHCLPRRRTASIISNGSLQSERSFSVRRPPAAVRWTQQRGKRQWTYGSASAYSVGHRSYASMSSWYTDTIHE